MAKITDPIKIKTSPNIVHFPPPTLSISFPVAALDNEAKIEYEAVKNPASRDVV